MIYSEQTPNKENQGKVLLSKAVTNYIYDYLVACRQLTLMSVDEFIARVEVTKDGPIYLAFPKVAFKAYPSEAVSSCRYDREEVRTAHISKHIETYLDDTVAQVGNKFHTTIYPSTIMEGLLLFQILRVLTHLSKRDGFGSINYPGQLAQRIINSYSIIRVEMDGLCGIISIQDLHLKAKVVNSFGHAILQASGWSPGKGVSPSNINPSPSSLGNEIRQNSERSQ